MSTKLRSQQLAAQDHTSALQLSSWWCRSLAVDHKCQSPSTDTVTQADGLCMCRRLTSPWCTALCMLLTPEHPKAIPL